MMKNTNFVTSQTRHAQFQKDRTTSDYIIRNILAIWIIVLTILYSTLSIVRHTRFQSGGFDLGIFDQAVWQYSRFQYPFNSVKERFILGDHLTLTLPFLGPLFRIWNDVRILLIFQALVISVSCYGVFLIARHRGFSPVLSCGLAFIYSLFYGIQYGVFFDFHPILLGVALLPFLAYFLEAGKKKIFILTLIAAFMTQENMGFAVAGLSLFYISDKKYRKKVFFLIIGGIAWSLIASRLIRTMSPVGYEYTPDIPFNPVVLVRRFFDSPEKRQVLLWTFGSFGFLPLLSLPGTLAIVADLAQYFVTGDKFVQMWSPYKHHRAILAVFGILAVMAAVRILERFRIRAKYPIAGLFILTLFLQYWLHLPLNKLSKRDFWQYEPWMVNNEQLFREIPADASVATQQNFVPHLTHRNQIYLVWPRLREMKDQLCGKPLCYWLDFGGKPEYLAVDTRPDQWLTQTLETDEHYREALSVMEKAGKIRLVKKVGDAKLFLITY